MNRTGHFDVAFPDLDRESFPFRSISIRGYVEGLALVKDEFIIQSSLATITGNGKIDLEHQQIDARGLVSMRIPGAGIVRRIPIFGSILDPSSLLGIPVRVTGSFEQSRGFVSIPGGRWSPAFEHPHEGFRLTA